MRTLRVPLAPSSASVVRHRLVQELATRVSQEVLDTAALVVSELVGNAVRYGQPLPGGGLEARWRLEGSALRVEVLDGGSGPPSAPPPAPVSAESGRGLELVEALAERWGRAAAGGGTAVWVELAAVPDAPAARACDDSDAPVRTLRLPDTVPPLPLAAAGAPRSPRVLHGSRVLRLP